MNIPKEVKKAVNEFLKNHDIEEVEKKVHGELNEWNYKQVAISYGNGEVIAFLGDETYTLSVNDVRGFKELVWD